MSTNSEGEQLFLLFNDERISTHGTLEEFKKNLYPKKIHAKNRYGETLLFLAVMEKQFEKAKLLLKKGANPNDIDSVGDAPLGEALRNDDFNMVKLLVQFGADIHYIDKLSTDSLYIPIYHNELHIAQFLIEKGAMIKRYREVIEGISSLEMFNLIKDNLHIFTEEGQEYWEDQKLAILMKASS